MKVFQHRFWVVVFSLALFFAPAFAYADPVREVFLEQPFIMDNVPNTFAFQGYATISSLGSLKIKARLDEVQASTGQAVPYQGQSATTGYLVNNIAAVSNHQYQFTGGFQGLTPGNDYVLTVYHDSNPIQDLESVTFTFQPGGSGSQGTGSTNSGSGTTVTGIHYGGTPIEVTIMSRFVQSTIIKFTGYAKIVGNQAMPMHVKAKWGKVSDSGYPNVSPAYAVNQSSGTVGSLYQFTNYPLLNLEPNTDYKIAFFDESQPSNILLVENLTTETPNFWNYSQPTIEVRKPGVSFQANSEFSYTTTSDSIILNGIFRSNYNEYLSLRFSSDGGSTFTSPVFQGVVAPQQEFPISYTFSALDPDTNYVVNFSLDDNANPGGPPITIWSDVIKTQPTSSSGGVATGGPYGTTLLTFNPYCATQQGAPASGESCIKITPNNNLNTAAPTPSGTATVESTKADSYSVSLVWGDSQSNMSNLLTTPVFSRVMNAGETDTFTYAFSGLTAGHTYWYTFVETADPLRAYMQPRSFTVTQSQQQSGGSGNNNGSSSGGSAKKPLVEPGNLVPCDGSAWQPCKFTHLMQLINNVIKWLIIIAIPISGIGFAYIGWLFISKGGSEEARSRAKHVTINMFLGLVFILGGWLIVNTVLDSLLDTTDTNNPATDYKLLEQV